MGIFDDLLKKAISPVEDTYHAAAQLAGAEPSRQTALRGGAYEQAPRQAAKLGYEMSGMGDIMRFATDPSLSTAAFAAMALPIPGKTVPLEGGYLLKRGFSSADKTRDVNKAARKLAIQKLVNRGVPKRQAAKMARNQFGIPVKYKLHDPQGLPVGSTQYNIKPDEVYLDFINKLPFSRNVPIEMFLDPPLRALEGDLRHLEGEVVNERLKKLAKIIAKRKGVRLGPKMLKSLED